MIPPSPQENSNKYMYYYYFVYYHYITSTKECNQPHHTTFMDLLYMLYGYLF